MFHLSSSSKKWWNRSRPMSIDQNLELVLHSCPTMTLNIQFELAFRISHMIFLRGPSTFFLTAKLLFITLQGVASKDRA
ncbi:hypothetical protein P3L10_019268 [Capsicum annuum]